MDYEFKLTPREGYLRIDLSGQNSYDAMRDGLRRTMKACAENDCYNVLWVSRLASMEVVEAYQIPDVFREIEFLSRYRWAWVILNQDATEIPQFIETVLRNRGLMNGAIFTDVDAARTWLLDKSAEDSA